MSTITAVMPVLRGVDPARRTAPYENWRPPVIGVSLLVPVGSDSLVVADLRDLILMPTGSVHDGRKPSEAAHDVLRGAPEGLPVLRRVALACTQMRRRKVITHIWATAPMSREDVGALSYHDPRADVRVLPTMRVVDELTQSGRLRVLVALQALATGETAYIEGGVVQPSIPPDLANE
ncbi:MULTISPECIES: hypothetical protein [Streptomyces]|uniref:NUDIX hydrolase n=1 Tax=Streptomyces galilaeus TaxID=33899 RepID=A0ABW9INC0_STRGJ